MNCKCGMPEHEGQREQTAELMRKLLSSFREEGEGTLATMVIKLAWIYHVRKDVRATGEGIASTMLEVAVAQIAADWIARSGNKLAEPPAELLLISREASRALESLSASGVSSDDSGDWPEELFEVPDDRGDGSD